MAPHPELTNLPIGEELGRSAIVIENEEQAAMPRPIRLEYQNGTRFTAADEICEVAGSAKSKERVVCADSLGAGRDDHVDPPIRLRKCRPSRSESLRLWVPLRHGGSIDPVARHEFDQRRRRYEGLIRPAGFGGQRRVLFGRHGSNGFRLTPQGSCRRTSGRTLRRPACALPTPWPTNEPTWPTCGRRSPSSPSDSSSPDSRSSRASLPRSFTKKARAPEFQRASERQWRSSGFSWNY